MITGKIGFRPLGLGITNKKLRMGMNFGKKLAVKWEFEQNLGWKIGFEHHPHPPPFRNVLKRTIKVHAEVKKR